MILLQMSEKELLTELIRDQQKVKIDIQFLMFNNVDEKFFFYMIVYECYSSNYEYIDSFLNSFLSFIEPTIQYDYVQHYFID